MAELTEDQKVFIVRELACFGSPSDVAAAVKEEFGVEITRMQVRNYNPTQTDVAKKWKALFEATREAFLKDSASIGIAQKVYRLRELQTWYQWAKGKKNAGLAREILKQAAEEEGGAYTNRRELTGKGGKDLAAGVLAVPMPLTAEEWAALASTQQASLARKAEAEAEAAMTGA
jgi:hypothetical protein